MNDFVTVLTVSYPQQLWIIKGKLESEGIECFLKDELTVQSNNLWSNAVGGVKLQVQNKDVDKAIELLTELGYIKENEVQPLDLLTRIDKKTSSIPFLKNLKVTTRIVVITLLSVFLILLISYIVLKPSKLDLLTKEAWFVDKVYYKNKLVGPKTIESFKSIGKGDIDFSKFGEMAEFREGNNLPVPGLQETKKDNYLSFPGLHGRIINGTWKLNGNVIVLQVDTLKYILDGSYNMDISDRNLTLRSTNTTIIAHKGL